MVGHPVRRAAAPMNVCFFFFFSGSFPGYVRVRIQ
jgi:hypothetical protein